MTSHSFKLKAGDSLVVTVGTESSGGSGSGGGSGKKEDPSTWPNAMQAPMWGVERRTGVTGQPGIEGCPYDDPHTVTCVPIPIPADLVGKQMLSPSVSSYQSVQYYREAILSHTPGDFANPIAVSKGNTATPSIEIGTHAQAGQTVYFCWRYWCQDLNNGQGGESVIPYAQVSVSYGGGWPR